MVPFINMPNNLFSFSKESWGGGSTGRSPLRKTTTTTTRFKSVLPVDNKIQFSRACTCRMHLTNLQIEGIVAMEH